MMEKDNNIDVAIESKCGSIKSKLLSFDHEIPDFDSEIIAMISEYCFDSGGNTMKVVVQNNSGQIYRIIYAIGMSTFMSVVNKLQDLELTDIRVNQIFSKDGIDSEFVPKN